MLNYDFFNKEVENQLNKVRIIIEDINEVIETIYENLYEGLPEIENNINLNAKETENLLDFFIKAEHSNNKFELDNESSYGISVILAKVQKNFENVQAILPENKVLPELLESFISTEKKGIISIP